MDGEGGRSSRNDQGIRIAFLPQRFDHFFYRYKSQITSLPPLLEVLLSEVAIVDVKTQDRKPFQSVDFLIQCLCLFPRSNPCSVGAHIQVKINREDGLVGFGKFGEIGGGIEVVDQTGKSDIGVIPDQFHQPLCLRADGLVSQENVPCSCHGQHFCFCYGGTLKLRDAHL